MAELTVPIGGGGPAHMGRRCREGGGGGTWQLAYVEGRRRRRRRRRVTEPLERHLLWVMVAGLLLLLLLVVNQRVIWGYAVKGRVLGGGAMVRGVALSTVLVV